MTQWRHGTCTPAHSKPPAHLDAHTLICPPLSTRVAKRKPPCQRKKEMQGDGLLTLGLAPLGRLLLVALPSLARSSLPAGHRATETLAPAPALHAGEAAACTPAKATLPQCAICMRGRHIAHCTPATLPQRLKLFWPTFHHREIRESGNLDLLPRTVVL